MGSVPKSRVRTAAKTERRDVLKDHFIKENLMNIRYISIDLVVTKYCNFLFTNKGLCEQLGCSFATNKLLKNSFRYSSATLWNSLPCNQRQAESLIY